MCLSGYNKWLSECDYSSYQQKYFAESYHILSNLMAYIISIYLINLPLFFVRKSDYASIYNSKHLVLAIIISWNVCFF